MMSGSLDPDIVALTRQRYRQSLAVAKILQGAYVVFHANYMGAFKLPDYRRGWHQRQIHFWKSLAREAEDSGLCILLENMWADDPDILVDILQEIDSPNFRACLDMSHVSLYSKQSFDNWIDRLTPWLHCCHLNNTNGEQDLHWPLKQGIIDYESVLTKMRRLPAAPFMTLEIPNWPAIEQSLPFFRLPGKL